MERELRIVVLGLSITSSWGNGHATTYRGLVRELHRRGHDVLFLERDAEWYASNRDLPEPPFCRTALYGSLDELRDGWEGAVRDADLAIVGSFVPEGIAVGEWVTRVRSGPTAFYDIDTPVTLAKLERGECEFLSPELVSRFDAYLSFSGGPILERIRQRYGVRAAWPLYCSFDPELYYPAPEECRWDLGYLGTYSDDRQPPLERLMLDAARAWPEGRFAVAGPQYPETVRWPGNVERIIHVPPREHRAFYNRQRFTLNITREDMIRAGYSPSVRLFEAAACGVPIISDYWDGLETFFALDREILISRSAEDTLGYLQVVPEERRREIAAAARRRVLAAHTAAHRAAELEAYAHRLQEAHAAACAPAMP
jgi:spore maturation protein CgeB